MEINNGSLNDMVKNFQNALKGMNESLLNVDEKLKPYLTKKTIKTPFYGKMVDVSLTNNNVLHVTINDSNEEEMQKIIDLLKDAN